MDIGALFRKLPKEREGRWDLLRHFFAEWFGQLGPTDGCTPQSIIAAETRLGLVFPTALREWYAIAGRRRGVWSRQDHFHEPEELRVKRDKLIICTENQSVVEWSVSKERLQEPDPPVLITEYGSTQSTEEAPSVSAFALAKMLLDAKFYDSTSLAANGQATDESLETIARNYLRLDFPDFNWPAKPTRIYGGDGLIIEIDGETWIWVTGRSRSTFCPAIETVAGTGVEWERVSGL